MLVLSRKPGEKVHIGTEISIVLVEVRGNRVRIGIDAPEALHVLREELYEATAGAIGRTEPGHKETPHAAGNP